MKLNEISFTKTEKGDGYPLINIYIVIDDFNYCLGYFYLINKKYLLKIMNNQSFYLSQEDLKIIYDKLEQLNKELK